MPILRALALCFVSLNCFSQWIQKTLPYNERLNEVEMASSNVIFGTSSSFIFKSTNAGATWEVVNKQFTNYSAPQSYLFSSSAEETYFINESVGFYFGWNTNQTNEIIFKTVDGGEHWTLVHHNLGGRIQQLQFVTATDGFAVGYEGRVLKTTDGGTTWTTLSTGTNKALFDLHFFNSTQGVAVGEQIAIRTNDGGLTWTSVIMSSPVRSVSFSDASFGIALKDDGLARTTNGGLSWSSLNTNLGAPQVGPSSRIRYVDGGSWVLSTANGLYKSEDGMFWVLQTSLPQNYIFAFDFFHASSAFISGYNLGYKGYYTSNGGDPIPQNDGRVFDLQIPSAYQCRGIQPVTVKIQNNAAKPMTSLTLHWSVDGVEQTPFLWTGNLLPGGSYSGIAVGSFNFTKTGKDIAVNVWCTGPNGQADEGMLDNSATGTFRFERLMGSYTIGGSGADFASIESALDQLRNYGLCDDVTFVINSGTYAGPFNVQASSLTDKKITIRSASGNPDDVIVNADALVNYSDVTLKGITFKSYSLSLFAETNVKTLLVEDCKLEVSYPGESSVVIIPVQANTNIVLKNNVIKGGAYGVSHYNYSWPAGAGLEVLLENNSFLDQEREGVQLVNSQGKFTLNGNTFASNSQYIYYQAVRIQTMTEPVSIVNNYLKLTDVGPTTLIRGITVSQSKANIIHNTISLRGNSTAIAVSLAKTFDSQVINNIISNSGNGTLLHFDHNTNLISDYNDLYTTGALGTAKMPISGAFVTTRSLDEWHSLVGLDVHSISADPQLSENDFRIIPSTTNYLLNGAGKPGTGVIVDAEGHPRQNPPDIGADEFAIPLVDLGITGIQPQNNACGYPVPVTATVKNFGASAMSSYSIQWKVNGVAQSTATNLALAPGAIANIVLGTVTFSAGVSEVEVKLINASGDLNTVNNTLLQEIRSGGMSGVYTVGGSSPNFATVIQALSALESSGACGDIVFNIRPGTYTGQLVIKNYAGLSELNTLTIQSESLDSTSVILQSPELPIFFDGAAWTTVQHVHLRATDPFKSIVELRNGASHNTVRSAIISSLLPANGVFSSPYTEEHFNTIERVRFSGEQNTRFSNPIELIGSFTSGVYEKGNVIRENVIENAEWGVTLGYQSDLTFEKNTVKADYPFDLQYNIDQFKINGNTFQGVYQGVTIGFASSLSSTISQITNNVIITENQAALSLRHSDNVAVLHNTMKSGGMLVFTVNIDGPLSAHFSDITIKNNIIVGLGDSYCIGYHPQAGITSDHNVFWTDKLQPFVTNYETSLGTYGYTVTYDDLYQWQQGTQHDEHSKFLLPDFTSPDDWHIDNDTRIKNMGAPVGINYDIDGDLRSSAAPDPGADEFPGPPADIDAGVVSVSRPQSCTSSQSTHVTLKNFGSLPLTAATIAWTINGQPMPAVNWSGTLALNEISESITLPSFSFDPVVKYEIKVWTEFPNAVNDQKHLNDTLRVLNIYLPLNGAYMVGNHPDAKFTDPKSAVAYLNKWGVCGPVTLNIASGNYNGRFSIRDFPGSSQTHPLIIQSLDQSATSVRLTESNWGPQFSEDPGDYVVMLHDAHHVTLRHLTIDSYYPLSAICFQDASNIQISNNLFSTEEFYRDDHKIIDLKAGHMSSNLIDHNEFVDGGFGVYYQTGSVDQLTIAHNTFRSQFHGAIWLTGGPHEGLTIDDNVIVCETNASSIGSSIKLTNCKSFTISNNRINAVHSTAMSLDHNGTRYTGGRVFNNMIVGNSTQVSGISSQLNRNISYVHNTVNLIGDARASFYTYADSVCTVMNNNFTHAGNGYSVWITDPHPDYKLQMDYNNFWSPSGRLHWDEGDYQSLEEFRTASGTSEHSLSTDPAYLSNDNLRASNPAINGNAYPIAWMTHDIDGVARDVQKPDIGINEFNSYPGDIGVTGIRTQIANLCENEFEVFATIRNFGNDLVGEFSVIAEINGSSKPVVSWTRALRPAEETEVSLGVITLANQVNNEIKAKTSLPNGLPDTNLSNDLFTLNVNRPASSGTFTVGGTSPDFTSVAEAVAFLNANGVCGPTTFLIRPGTYSGNFTLNAIAGASLANRIVFRSENGNPASVIIAHSGSSESDKHVWKLNNASFVTIRDVTIQATGPVYACGIHMTGDIQHTRIVHNVVSVSSPGDGSKYAINVSSGIRSAVTIRDNEIYEGNIGVLLSGNGNVTAGQVVQDSVYHNRFVNQGGSAIYASYLNNGLIAHNTFTSVYLLAEAIYLVQTHNSTVDANTIRLKSIGVYVQESQNCILSNNFITVLEGVQTNSNNKGILIWGGSGSKIYHNTVVVEEDHENANALYMTSINPSSPFLIRNNILVNNAGGEVFVMINISLTPSVLSMDHNNLYTTGTYLGSGSFPGYEDFRTLDEWNTYSSLDTHSLSVDPQFVSSSDLHARAPQLTGAGMDLNIAKDIDGETRHADYPTIGADEFGTLVINDVSIISFEEVTLCYETQPFALTVRNNGVIPVTYLKILWSIDGVDQSPIEYHQTIDRQSAGRITLQEISLSPEQLHNVRIRITEPNHNTDETPGDNEAETSITVYKPVEIGAAVQSFCTAPANLAAPLGYTSYSWTEVVDIPQPLSETKDFFVSRQGRYVIEVNDLNSCLSRDTVEIRFESPALAISPEATKVCSGKTVKLKTISSGGFTGGFTWFRNSVVIAGNTSGELLINDGGEYMVKAVSTSCGEISSTVVITYGESPPVPVISVSGSAEICEDQTTNLTLNGSSSGQSLQWKKDGLALAGKTAADLTVNSQGHYTLEVQKNGCTAASAPVSILLLDTPQKPVITGVSSVCAGSSITLTAPAGFQRYAWSTGETTQTIQVASAGNYSVVTGNSLCTSVSSNAHSVTVTPLPTPEITLDSDGALTTTVASTYQWFLNGQNIQGASQQKYLPKQSGEYRVDVTSNGCKGISDTFVLIVTDLEERMNLPGLSLYPNPTSRWLHITVAADGGTTPSVIITNSLGVQMDIKSVDRDHEGYRTDLDGFSAGVYFVQACVGERCATRKIMVH